MDCKNCEEKEQACVPFFLHENMVMHFSKVNRRMVILFAIWGVIMAIVIGIFVYGNTVREKQLIDLVNQHITEVEDAKAETSP